MFFIFFFSQICVLFGIRVDLDSIHSLFAALSYGIASMAMVFINKAVLMQYSDSMTLLTLQVLILLPKVCDFVLFDLFCLLILVCDVG